MKVLIVHAHNEPQSFNSAMARLAVEVLEDEANPVIFMTGGLSRAPCVQDCGRNYL
ncbi:NAD(P)H-dependent oxidoreductase [Pseudomonas japonica]|uniref:Flavodoxin-like fold n=1 Tax=Pseudomonas japonica TaxID=256466 RepID=A0A239KTR3_9PSED|nr:NAD(P)H-dependent oxidoreductase [Pseudomonas japonica]SNT21410.1 Flavodoxin-like fold [Pseudomonas japonica]